MITLRSLRPPPLGRALATLTIAAAATLAAGCAGTTAQEPPATTVASASSEPGAAAAGTGESSTTASGATITYDEDGAVRSLSYPGKTGSTALELLLTHDEQAQVSGEGELAFVTGIAGQTADPASQFWSLTVDGEFAEVGAGSLATQDGEMITWTLTEFE